MQSPVCPAPRVSRACDRCRARKVRCIPSDHPSTCRRCLTNSYTCLTTSSNKQRRTDYALRKRRKIVPSEEPQEQALEEEVDNVPPKDSDQDSGDPQPTQSTSSQDSVEEVTGLKWLHRYVLQKLLPKAVQSPPHPAFQSPAAASHSRKPDPRHTTPNVDASRLLHTRDVQGYLHKFERLRDYFPFVILPDGWSVESMRSDHPVLLLGILSAMTLHTVDLNVHLHTEFIRVIAEKAVTAGEKNLDIIQGILVQLAWYPMHLKPRSRQVLQILQIAISMIMELHFDEPPEPVEPQRDLTLFNSNYKPKSSTEVQRAYLGCYYLSSAIAVCFGRNNNLPYTEYTEFCVSRLGSKTGIHRTPESFVTWDVRLQRLIEQSDDASRNKRLDSFTAAAILESLTHDIDMVLASAPLEIQQTRETSPNSHATFHLADTTAPAQFKLESHYAAMKISAIALHKPSAAEVTVQTGSDAETWRLPTLDRCFHATKAFFETFTSLQISEYRNFTFAEWAQLIKALTIMSSLCFPVSFVPQWDAARARREAQFGMILESICYRMQELTSTGKRPVDSENERLAREEDLNGTTSAPDHFFMFKSVLKILKEVYDESVVAALRDSERKDQQRQQGTRCPVLNGSITNSEYWEVLQDSDMMGFGGDDLLSAELRDPDFTASLVSQYGNDHFSWSLIRA